VITNERIVDCLGSSVHQNNCPTYAVLVNPKALCMFHSLLIGLHGIVCGNNGIRYY